MYDWDTIIIGGGPAGLAAGIYLCRANWRTLLLSKESYGGLLQDIELVENYPGFSNGISGAVLASEMVKQAENFGLSMQMAEVSGIEMFSSTYWVNCANGEGYSTRSIILANGSKHRRLGVPGEDALSGKGVVYCAFCDGGQFSGQEVIVCGGGDAGISAALYMAKIAEKVTVIEAMPKLTAAAILQERAASNPKITILCGTQVKAILGDDKVEAVELRDTVNDKVSTLKVSGVLVNIGQVPDTLFLQDVVPLDEMGFVITNKRMETEIPRILAAGDIRSDSCRQVAAAVGDGVMAAMVLQGALQQM